MLKVQGNIITISSSTLLHGVSHLINSLVP